MKRKIYKVISGAKKGVFALALVVSGVAHAQITYSLQYTGAVQTLTLPAGNWGIECWGANGGDVTPAPGSGGRGGYAKGEFNVTTSGTLLNILIGGKGTNASGTGSPGGAGGWNGGGGGGYCGRSGGGGGGATDVRVGGTAAGNRIIVAGGGGGAAYYAAHAIGGNGGGQTGAFGDFMSSANALTAAGGGAPAVGGAPGIGGTGYPLTDGSVSGGGGGGHSPGGFGQPGVGGGPGGIGGNLANGSTGGSGGGGGGYAGGAGGTQTVNAAVGGGGGSGYIGGVQNGITVQTVQPGFMPNPEILGHGYVIITRLCDLQVTASKNPICAGETITLNSNAGSNISWSTGATTASITVTPLTTTQYTMSGVSSSSTACTATVTILVEVNPIPVITAVAFPPVMCVGGTGTLIANGASTYTWSNGDLGSISIITPSVNGVYTATGVSTNGCKSTQTVSININTNSLTITQNTTICSGSSVSLTAGGVSSAMWSTGNAFLTISVKPTATTVYTVSGIDALGCTLTNSVMVSVNPLPVVTISTSAQTICRGESVNLTANGASTYVWDNAATSASITRTLSIDIPYQFSVTGTDANGCSASTLITVTAKACTGIIENTSDRISIFPNPVRNEVIISGATSGRKLITVSDLNGKVLLITESSDNDVKLDLANLPEGVYNLQVKDADVTSSHKLIKL